MLNRRLEVAESWGWRGFVQFVVCDAETGQVKRTRTVENMIVNGALNAVAAHLRGDQSTDLQIGYVAVGDNSTAPAAGDTQLGNETSRKQVTKQTNDGTGRTRTEVFLSAAEAVGDIEEVGWFANGATAVADSGLLVARVLYGDAKTASETLTIVRTDILGRS